MVRVLCVIIGYFFGIIQTGFIYGKLNHIDIRNHGSGNAGATNALRTLGWRAGVTTFVGDVLKAILAITLVKFIFKDNDMAQLYAMYTGLGVVLGHNYPFYLKFKGGKGIASTVGLIFAIDPLIGITIIAIFLIIFFATKYVSLGSIIVMVIFVVELIIFGQTGKYAMSGVALYEMYAIAAVLAAMGWWRHRANIVRLLKGTENKINFSKIKK